MFGVLGGSGLSNLSDMQVIKVVDLNTPYGKPSDSLTFLKMLGSEFVFLPRHGSSHSIAPHKINYRANMWALKELGVTKVIAVTAVGGIDKACVPGALVVPNQIIDYTTGRINTFFESYEDEVVHVDFTYPYDENIRLNLIDAATSLGIKVIQEGVYGATQGPRLESAGEINRMDGDGVTVVGMTGMPECGLARELGLKYATLSVVANWAAGRGGKSELIDMESIKKILDKTMLEVLKILRIIVGGS